jgi:hypothetical protein
MAAAAGGISKQTLKNWRHRAAAGEEPFLSFFARLEKAEACGAVAALSCIQEAAAKGTWQAAAWMLERRYPKQFALRRPEPTLPAVTDEEAEKLASELKALAK